MVKFNARGKEFDIPKYLLNKHPDSLMCLLSNSDSIPVFRVDGAIYLNVDPLHLKFICNMYNTGKHFGKNTDVFLMYDLKYLGFCVDYQVIPTLFHPIIGLEEKTNSTVEYGKEEITVQSEKRSLVKYSRVHCFDGEIVIVDLSDANLIGTQIGNIIYGCIDECLIYKNEEYIDVSICIDSALFNNILSILRDGYAPYHEYLAGNIEEDVEQNMEEDIEENIKEDICRRERLCEYLISYDIICRLE